MSRQKKHRSREKLKTIQNQKSSFLLKRTGRNNNSWRTFLCLIALHVRLLSERLLLRPTLDRLEDLPGRCGSRRVVLGLLDPVYFLAGLAILLPFALRRGLAGQFDGDALGTGGAGFVHNFAEGLQQ